MSSSQLRSWQQEAIQLYLQKLRQNQKQMLWEATPGAGKTTAALHLVKHQLANRLAEKALIVVPTSHLRIQWSVAALSLGLQLDNRFSSGRLSLAADYHGAVVTYQQFQKSQRTFAALASKSVVILDEVHHTGEGLSWGSAILRALEKSRFILCLSGTAFRSDNNPIPFVAYDSDGISSPDFTYSYSRAIREKVCRPVAIFTYGGEVSWQENERLYQAKFGDALDSIGSARRLRAALDPSSGWLKPMLQDAHKMLQSIRRVHQNAGGLIVCPNQTIARQTAKLVHEVCNEKATLVLSDDNTASKKIKAFSQGSEHWLVACNMVSEGVDIPRLRVGVYATTIKTKMYFRQFLGRIVRTLPKLQGPQVAYLYLPADPTLSRLAEEIEEEIQHNINKPVDSQFAELDEIPREKKDYLGQSWAAVDAVNSGVDSIILHGNQLALFGKSQEIESIHSAINLEVETKLEERLTRSEQKSELARRIRTLVADLHRKSGQTHSYIHKKLNIAQAVDSQTACTLKQLQERIDLLEKMY